MFFISFICFFIFSDGDLSKHSWGNKEDKVSYAGSLLQEQKLGNCSQSKAALKPGISCHLLSCGHLLLPSLVLPKMVTQLLGCIYTPSTTDYLFFPPVTLFACLWPLGASYHEHAEPQSSKKPWSIKTTVGQQAWSNRSHNVAGSMRNRNHEGKSWIWDPQSSRRLEQIRSMRQKKWSDCKSHKVARQQELKRCRYKASRNYNTEKPWINWNWSPRSQEAAENRKLRKYIAFERNFLKDLH